MGMRPQREWDLPILFFNDTATTEIYTLSLHDALPISKYWVEYTLECLKMLLTGEVGVNQLSGPVGIVEVVNDTYDAAAPSGWSAVILSMMNLGILISANLGVMNLLPIPALDGGRLVFLLIEAVRRKRIAPEKEGMVHFIGFAALMALMVFVMYNDIMRLF